MSSLPKWTVVQRYMAPYVIVLNLPSVKSGLDDFEKKKVENPSIEKFVNKLKSVLHTIIHKFQPNIQPEDIEIKYNDQAQPSFAFIKCKDSSEARLLKLKGDFCALDKKTRLRFLLADEFEKARDVNIQPPEPLPAPPKDTHFSWFLHDDRLRDQILCINGKMPKAYWFNHTTADFEEVSSFNNNIQSVEKAFFTPDGAFLVTINKSKINFYAGETWSQISSFEHKGVDDVLFSLDSRYMIAKAKILEPVDNPIDPQGMALFDTVYGTKIKKIPLIQDEFDYVEFGFNSYLYTCSSYKDKSSEVHYDLFCYPAPKFELPTPEPLAKDILEFAASPTCENVFIFRLGHAATPPRLIFLNPTTRQQIYTQPAYNATHAEAIWHPKLPLCMIIITADEHGKSTRKITVFDFRTKNFAQYSDPSIKGEIIDVNWDKTQAAFATIIDSGASGRSLVYYLIGTNLAKQGSYNCGSSSRVQISPAGRFAVTDDADHDNKLLQFWDLTNLKNGNLKRVEIQNLKDIQWDPSGFFLLIGAPKEGWNVLLLDGTSAAIPKRNQKSFSSCTWRPYSSDLPPEETQAVEGELPDAVSKFGRFGIMDAGKRQQELNDLKKEKVIKWQIEKNKLQMPYVNNITIDFQYKDDSK